MRPPKLAFLCALFAGVCLCARSQEPLAGALVEWPSSASLSLSENDALEFSLRLPPAWTENAPESVMPAVSVWFLEAGATQPAAGVAQAGHVLAVKSPRSSEWLVQVRGLHLPAAAGNAPPALLVRWSYARSDGSKSSGDIHYPGRIVSASKPLDVIMLMDGSWSMNESDPKRQRVAALRDFIESARHSSAIGRVGIVQFDNRSVTLLGLTPLSGDFNPAIERISAVGLTDIDGGIRHALRMFEEAGSTGAAIVLFTDGNQEPGPYKDGHLLARKAGVAIHTMTLGRDADRDLLRRIAAETGGSYADAQKDNDISAAYGAIVGKLINLHSISLGEIGGDRTVAAPVDASCSALQLAVAAVGAGALTLDLPGGKHWSSGESINPQYFAESPAPGELRAHWEQKSAAKDAPPAIFSAAARTPFYPLFFRASPLPASPVEIDANDPNLLISLFNAGVPVAGAKIEAQFDYSFVEQDTRIKRSASVSLFDDGKRGDGLAGDGIYASGDEALNFISASKENLSGTLKVVVSGVEKNQAFRRELSAQFETRRAAPPALLISGAYDFGTHFAGEKASAEVALRVRGPGGEFNAALENAPVDFADAFKFTASPPALKSKQRLALPLALEIPEAAKSGDYSGVVKLSLKGVESIAVPWHLKIAAVDFSATPAKLELGELLPGEERSIKLRISTSGGDLRLGGMTLAPLKNVAIDDDNHRVETELQLLNGKPFEPFTLDKTGREIELHFSIPGNAVGGEFHSDLTFIDAQNRTLGRVPVSLQIAEIEFKPIAKIDFGAVESGDKLQRELLLEWAGEKVPPLTPSVKVLLGKQAQAPEPRVSPPVKIGNAWTSKFTLGLLPDCPTGDIGGAVAIEAGPARTYAHWSARIIKPALHADLKAVDFGRIYPGKKITRSLILRAASARPVDVEISAAAFKKPKVAGVEIPAAALAAPTKLTLNPGTSVELPLLFALPDNAQDGQYQSILTLASRLGRLEIPLSVKAVDVIDAAAFHVSPPSITFHINDGEPLPQAQFTVTSHDDEPIALALKIPAPIAYLFAKQPQPSDENISVLNLTLPPRGALTLFVRPGNTVRDGESGAVQIDGAGEHQELELRVERVAAPVAAVVSEPPRLLNYILSFFVLLLIIAAVLVHLLVKRAGARCIGYAVLVHLAVFSMVLPKQAILDALPESIEITLLDAQESLGMALSNTQARRLDALHSGTGSADDKRAAGAAAPAQNALAQNAPGPIGAAELPAPAAGPASPQPGPVNLEAARGIERPLRPADVPQQARGSRNVEPADDAPLALDATAPIVKQQPAPAEKFAPDAPRAAASSALQTAFSTSEISEISSPVFAANVPRSTAAPSNARASLPARQAFVENDRGLNLPAVKTVAFERQSIAAQPDAPIEKNADAPLAFDNEPVSAPQVKARPNPTERDTKRSMPVAAYDSTPGTSAGVAVEALNLSAPGKLGSPGDAPGESFVALARTGPLPIAAAYAGLGGDGKPGAGAAAGFAPNDTTETGIGAGQGRQGGGLPGGGDEPLAIGTDGGDGPGRRSIGGGAAGSGSNGGRGSGNGSSLIGGLNSGSGKSGSGGGGENGSGGSGRSSAAGIFGGPSGQGGLGGLGGDGAGLASGGGNGVFEIGTLEGRGSAWHGRPAGGGTGKGLALASGPSSAQLESGNGLGAGGNGAGGSGAGGTKNGSNSGNGGAPGGKGNGPGGRMPGFGLDKDGPGGFGDKPLALGPAGGGGTRLDGKGSASGGGLPGGKGGGGGDGIGRSGAAGGTGLSDSFGGGLGGLGGLDGSGFAPGQGHPGGSGHGVSLARGPGSKELEDSNTSRLSQSLGAIAGPPHRGITTPYTGGLVRVNIGLAKHSGDWNSSPTALQFLRSAFIERSGLPELEVAVPTVDLHDLAALMRCRVIMITSNFPVQFKPAEIEGMREYIKRGGTVWVNDSSASDYEKFDEAFRPQVPLLVPGATLLKLPLKHDFFSACYDLSKGFKGFRIPPGDKYRQDYMEAAFVPDDAPPAANPNVPAGNSNAESVDLEDALIHRRAGIIYTRNDYSDGLEIDPRMNAGMKSLTDLTNAEMLESSLRFGMNLVAYAMGSQGLKLPPPPESIAEFEKLYRYKGPPLPVLDDFSVLEDQWKKPVWVAEKDWCNETQLDFKSADGGKAQLARVGCKAGSKFKAAITRFALTDLSAARALVFDLHSSLSQGLNVSLLFHTKDGRDYESRAVFVRPGWNRGMRFPLAMGDMKSGASKVPWQAYDNAFEPRDAVERISILLYNLNESGTIQIGSLSVEK